MAEVFELKIIEPDGMFYEGQASFLEFASVMGEMGVYANHIPLTTILAPGVVKIHNDGQVKKAAVMGGFIEIQKDKITIMAENAEWPEEIDVERAKAAKKRAEERLQRKEAGLDTARAEAALKRAMARISAAR
ncbi:MAG: F0F1 ATP synthase subunit epsilon [Faecalimonas sp.]|nr:F0F1 ATP synthase subunit epsilon [Faecalimonas sp.]